MEETQSDQKTKEERKEKLAIDSSGSSNGDVRFKLDAYAPQFLPKSRTQMPISAYYYPLFHYPGDVAGSDGFFVGEQEPATAAYFIPNPNFSIPKFFPKNVLTDDLRLKIIKQVEYQLSDMSLIANESLSKQISKDPEGYVPISFIASTKKIRSLITNNYLLAKALRSSSKLVVSDDGKKVKRKHPFTDKDREEVQSHTVVVENLPEDHSHQNIDRIFNIVGSVKNIRICHPHESRSSRSKSEFCMSNELHALVEFESAEIAEKAVEKLSDERDGRKGLQVRLLLRILPKSVPNKQKSEFDSILDEDDLPSSFQLNNLESTKNNGEDNGKVISKKRRGKRGKGRGLGERGLAAEAPPQPSANMKKKSNHPRMPDGTKGFSMGRGKPLMSPHSE
ncbi:pentatricopeptide repeat-containing protein [Hibiscus syriacus]|uniref:Pentatricopeptide repeat-containing protein n=1 Tax=Hibiscus syriacus TaxID=106335 RepID=A0A6A3AGE3_HIBSY|nr:la-related protein 6C-like [Hibiscus syriacus]KAE8703138.1 pentatricopeptide repeat-containing protein [Hibiscus syriacus]